MSHRHGQHARFPSPDAAIRGIIHARGADGVFDSHVAAIYGARVYADHEDAAGRGADVPGTTTRPNIAYYVDEYADESDETDAICQLVGEKLEQYTAPAKIIVYGGTIKRTQELSQGNIYPALFDVAIENKIKNRITQVGTLQIK
ncbi:hypothetical protein V500_00808 [Pseudogymnoascus sp. VKM F-4518 (FW-2643)]|nr:hypothetical protein V500_00808 [Pseudogymnoascus sp. VKM F-4518 (FW-2643)]